MRDLQTFAENCSKWLWAEPAGVHTTIVFLVLLVPMIVAVALCVLIHKARAQVGDTAPHSPMVRVVRAGLSTARGKLLLLGLSVLLTTPALGCAFVWAVGRPHHYSRQGPTNRRSEVWILQDSVAMGLLAGMGAFWYTVKGLQGSE